MKLSSSTGDFSYYANTVPEKVRCFRDTKFRYINLEQSGNTPALLAENDEDWRHFADACAEAASDAGVRYVLSHAPCLHNAVVSALKNPADEVYQRNIRIIRRSIEVAHALAIPHLVVHACVDPSFDADAFFQYNKMFYRDLLDLAEARGVTLLVENWSEDFTHFSTGEQMRRFLDEMDHPMLGACWDTAHGNISKDARAIGQYRNIVTFGTKLKALHIADNFGDSHHHSWPFAGIINFDGIMQGLIDIGYDGYFNFEASYTLLHHNNPPYRREPWEHEGKTVTTLLDPTLRLKQKAVDLLYDIGEHILRTYDCFEG